MYPDVLRELATAIRKLYTLEESIVREEKIDVKDLRTKQAVLVSDVIQALQHVESSMKQESRPVAKPAKTYAETNVCVS